MEEMMARIPAFTRIWLALLVVASSAAADDATHTLRYRFTPGESVYFSSHNETTRRYALSAHEVNTNDSVDSLKHYKVLSVTPDGGAVLELTIDRTKMACDDGTIHFAYDSTTDKDPPDAFQEVHGTIGRPWLRVTVNALGQTTNSETPRGVKVPESADYLSRVLPVLPEEPIAIGKSWKEQVMVDVTVDQVPVEEGQTPLKRSIKLQRVYTLQSVEDGIATLALRTEVLTPRRTPKQDVELVQRLFRGTVTIDTVNGRLVGRDLTIDGSVLGYDGPMSVMSVKMTQKDAYVPTGASTAVTANAASK